MLPGEKPGRPRWAGKLGRAALLALTAALLQTGCSLLGIRTTEEASYQLLREQGQFDIRRYEPLLVATTRVDSDFDEAGEQAFRRLFSYISGDNRDSQEIAMTIPVIASERPANEIEGFAITQQPDPETDNRGWRFMFVLPAGFTLQNAPEPADERVRLEQLPARKVAVLQYSGSWDIGQFDDHADRLLQWLRELNLQADSAPRLAAYDPPLALPFLRRNEIMIDIKS